MEKLIVDESQKVDIINDSLIWLRLVKGADALINSAKMPAQSEYGVQDTGDQYK